MVTRYISIMEKAWQFWIDRGGTFTDIIAKKPEGGFITHKLLSVAPERYEDAAYQGIFDILKQNGREDDLIEAIKMGTTVATNALLERKGERCALIVTKGFKDALRIAYQNRPKIFARKIELPEMLYETVREVHERISAQGEIIHPLDLADARQTFKDLYHQGFRSMAILLMHGYRFPAHEKKLGELAKEMGFAQISISHEIVPLMKFVARGDTSIADAYLSPVLRRYIDRLSNRIQSKNTKLLFMQSNGGLAEAHRFQGKDAILSGPAGGLIGAVETAKEAGFEKIIGFDMGGTSTDVSHYAGHFERSLDNQIAGVRLRAPMLQIHTIAAGGGSILHYDGMRFRVGPDSAGADPGPASYRRGGPLTVTDANLLLGRLQANQFPQIFGHDANQSLDEDVVREKFSGMAAKTGRSPEDVAQGFIDIATHNMANAIKEISVTKGYDVTQYILNCFGGAGGQLCCLVADLLGISRIFIHPFAGLLSAYGMGLAAIRRIKNHAIEAPLSTELLPSLASHFSNLEKEALAELDMPSDASASPIFQRRLLIRYEGTDKSYPAEYGNLDEIKSRFEIAHKNRYGFIVPDKKMIVEALELECIQYPEHIAEHVVKHERRENAIIGEGRLWQKNQWQEVSLYRNEYLHNGQIIEGPAIIIDANSTIIVDQEWRATMSEKRNLLLERTKMATRDRSGLHRRDPVLLEIFNNLFMSIAEQMGSVLENTSHSVNIKERLDFSCALFDHEARLIANAPHMPIHLGSMGESVLAIKRGNPNMQPGDSYITNAPYNGGTHLPDVTVVTPIHDDHGKLLFFVASRGHHADIGGMTPGSMPPDSKRIEEEGVLIDNFKLVEKSHWREKELRTLLQSGPYPVRNVEQNIADLAAQMAANEKGRQELQKMLQEWGTDTIVAYMRHVRENAAESVRRAIAKLHDGAFTYPMDNGAQISVRVTIDHLKQRAIIDFTGTSAQQENNFNAPSAIARAACLYVFRTLIDEDIPMNEGCLEPLDIIIPKGSMLDPTYPAAVVAGNVETSQVITDALYGALGIMASAQDTMNNFTFGNERYQYYETIAGGSGAGPDFNGTDAVQTHMTNSRLTDPEILEWRFPVRLEEFSIRLKSGGEGNYCGGNGVVRKICFLEKMMAVILANRRKIAPFGLKGGSNGLAGHNYVIRANGEKIALAATDKIELQKGDCFIIETPGGGGYGSKTS